MSVHKSLRLKGSLARMRNVLSRGERLERMKEQGKWKAGDPVYGIPKTRVLKAKA